MFRSITAAAIALAAVAAPAGAAPLSTWYGQFGYEHALGRIGETPGDPGVAIFVKYTLSLGPAYGATGCRLTVEGYQTYKRLQCTATPQEGSVIIKFYRFAPGNIGSGYRMGEHLVTMTRTEDGLETTWQGIGVPEGARPRGMALRRIR